jgi:hypothetical protein
MLPKHLRFLRGLGRHIRSVNGGAQPVYLDYPVHVVPRYGWGRPRHRAIEALLAERRDAYRLLLRDMEGAADEMATIPLESSDGRTPCWHDPYMSSLDAAMLYSFPELFRPRRYLEVGSGNSTRFVRHAVEHFGLTTKMTSIDPSPRAEVDDICDEVIRAGLEDAPAEIFESLEPNDILMLDGSHRCLQNSDVTVTFLEILPRLGSGVLVFMHDIYLPDDYPEAWRSRYYSEQYLLAVLLEADAGRRYEVVFPGHFCETDAELGPDTLRTWRRIAPETVTLHSSGFWLRVR